MSPEQANGNVQGITERTDVYGLGACLYYVLTGISPIRGANLVDVLQQVKEHEPISPRSLNNNVDRDLETICQKCLEKNPQRRYESAQAVADDLIRYLQGKAIHARPVSGLEKAQKWFRREPKLAALVMVSVLSILAIIGALLTNNVMMSIEKQKTSEALEELQKEKRETLLATRNANISAAQAYRLSNQPGRRFKALQNIDKAVQINSELELSGKYDDELTSELIEALAIPLDLRPRKTWYPKLNASHFEMDFSPDMKQFAIGSNDGKLRLFSAETGKQKYEYALHGRFIAVRFSPDGKWLATNIQGTQFRLFRVEQEQLRLVWEAEVESQCFDFHPNRAELAVGRPSGIMEIIDLETFESSMEFGPISDSLWMRFSPDGNAVILTGASRARIVNLESGDESWQIEHRMGFNCAEYNSDGTLFVVADGSGSISVFDEVTGGKNFAVQSRYGPIKHAFFIPNSEYFCCQTFSGSSLIYKVFDRDPVLVVNEALGRINKQGTAVSGSTDSQVSVWDLAMSSEFFSPRLNHQANDVSISGHLPICIAATNQKMRVWRTDHFTPMADFDLGPVDCLAFNPGDGSLVTADRSQGIRKWPVKWDAGAAQVVFGPALQIMSAKDLTEFPGFRPQRVQFSKDGTMMACSCSLTTLTDVRVLVFNEDSPKPKPLRGNWPAKTLSISPSGKYIATGATPGGLINVWDSMAKKLLTEIPAKGKAVARFVSNDELAVGDSVNGVTKYTTPDWKPVDEPSDIFWDHFMVLKNENVFFGMLARGGFEFRTLDLQNQFVAWMPDHNPAVREFLNCSMDGRWIYSVRNSQPIFWNLEHIRKQLAKRSLHFPRHRTVCRSATSARRSHHSSSDIGLVLRSNRFWRSSLLTRHRQSLSVMFRPGHNRLKLLRLR